MAATMALDTLAGDALLIGGERRAASDGATVETYDPATGGAVAHVARAREPDVDLAVGAARSAFAGAWREVSPYERGRLLLRIAEALREEGDGLAELTALNAGLPLSFARADVENAARYFEYYAGLADKIHGESIPLGHQAVDYTEREPWGVCAVIAPFNAPHQVTARSVAPALAAGNTVVIKAADQAPLPFVALARTMAGCDLPPGAVNLVTGLGPDAGAHLAGHAGVDHITFTGSVATGQVIMRTAADQLTPVTLELGGKSPQVVFADADLDALVDAVIATTMPTAGQICSAGTRLLVDAGRRPELLERLAAACEAIELGAPLDGAPMGPVVSRRQHEQVLGAIEQGRRDGGRVVTGGVAPADSALGDGFFVSPTVFDGVDPAASVAREEIFGPVLVVIGFDDEREAVTLANRSEYGLVAGVWTRDVARAHRVARQLEVGQVFINGFGVGGGVALPFGGYKKSGIGREKGVEGLREYTQVKNVCVRIDG